MQLVQNNFKLAASKKHPSALAERKLSVTQETSILNVVKSQKKIATIIAIREGSIEPKKSEQ
jgi:hypothetical protein